MANRPRSPTTARALLQGPRTSKATAFASLIKTSEEGTEIPSVLPICVFEFLRVVLITRFTGPPCSSARGVAERRGQRDRMSR